MIVPDWLRNRWLRKAIFVALNLAAGLALYGLVIAPVWAMFSERDSNIARQREVLARLTAMAGQEPSVQAAARDTADELKRGELLIGPNDGVINADLQTRLKTMAMQAGARLRSVQGLPATTSEQVRYAGARLDIQGTLRTIERALHAIESGRPYLFVTAASLKLSPGAHNPREEPLIEARLDVLGAVQIEERAP
jgi:general secretion pathway protein M